MEISRIIVANVNFAILILKSFLKIIASPILDITKPSAVDMDVPPPVNGAYKLGIANQCPIRATRAIMNEILAPRYTIFFNLFFGIRTIRGPVKKMRPKPVIIDIPSIKAFKTGLFSTKRRIPIVAITNVKQLRIFVKRGNRCLANPVGLRTLEINAS